MKVRILDHNLFFINENPTAIGPTAKVVNTISAAISTKDSIEVV